MPSDFSPTLPAGFAGFKFDNTYARLPRQFFARVNPTPVKTPGLVKVNHDLAAELGLDAAQLESPEGIEMLAGNRIPAGAEPLAQAYAGHQFGYLNQQLGDGRAILLGEVIDRNGQRRDVQLKGPGITPFSRSGDGRAALGPVIREYLLSEAMYKLGIRTTRALAAVTTGEAVYRETVLPGAVLTRVAASHIRIGTFEYFRVRNQQEAVKQLADYVIQRHYPHVAAATNPYLALLGAVMDAQARLVSSWLHVAFIHGVMNTDNMSISGETIDYGPCAFMDVYDPTTVFSSIDRSGRYAYGNQGSIALWNLARLAECLLPLFDADTDKAVAIAEESLANFGELFNQYWLAGMRRKLGLNSTREADEKLIGDLLQLMRDRRADFTLTFRRLAECVDSTRSADHWLGLFQGDKAAVAAWLQSWRVRLTMDSAVPGDTAAAMNQTNPLYIPRNQNVEAVISAAMEDGDYAPLEEMLKVLRNPFVEQTGMDKYAAAPEPPKVPYKTFCGT